MIDIPFVDTVATGQNIDRLRNAAGLSVKDMQMIFGFATPQAIYKWIHGTIRRPAGGMRKPRQWAAESCEPVSMVNCIQVFLR